MKIWSTIAIGILFICQNANCQAYKPSVENLNNREWFQDAKFGLFIHWGIYSVLGEHEWVMETKKFDKNTYEKVAAFFNPSVFDADEIVLMAKSAGMKYVTITAKHHDGFAMYDSKVSNWDIIDRTQFKRDVLKEMAEACKKHGLKLFFYYSQLDWHHNDYFPRGDTGKSSQRPDKGEWQKYIDYMQAQLTELLTNYGDVAGIWFDGWWDKKDADWRLNETYDLIHALQPSSLIGSNHHLAPIDGEDFQMFEKDLPGENKGGFSEGSKIGTLPLETAETMANRWGFSLQDKSYKSSKDIIRYIVKAAGHNSNFLLNVGPMPNGKIQPEFIDTLAKVGIWMDKYGGSIYGTRQGPIAPQIWGVSTQKGKNIYIHILNWNDSSILIPRIEDDIVSIRKMESGKLLKFSETEFGTLVNLEEIKEDVDNILVIQIH